MAANNITLRPASTTYNIDILDTNTVTSIVWMYVTYIHPDISKQSCKSVCRSVHIVGGSKTNPYRLCNKWY